MYRIWISECLILAQYPVFEAAITGRGLSSLDRISNIQITLPGRAALEGAYEDDSAPKEATFRRASGMIDMLPQTEEEMEAIRNAVINREGLLLSVFDILRRVPRRVLMVLKLNDLTRHAFFSLEVIKSSLRQRVGALITH